MDLVANLAQVIDDARALVGAVTPDDLAKPTPCTDWDVNTLVQHMIGVATIYGRAFGVDEAATPASPGRAGAPNAELVATYQQATDDLLAAAQVPGAFDRTVKLTSLELPGHLAVRLVVAEQLIHSWDLAQALGRSFAMDESLAAETLEGLREALAAIPGVRGPGKAFGEEVACPPDAPAQDRLLAFAGRHPG